MHEVPERPRKDVPELLTVAEVSELTRLSSSSIYRWAREGRIPGALHIGKRWLFDKAKLLDWLEAGAPGAL